ncbi:hypothetical protein HRJ34_14745 [Rhizorhabdus wittichii]|uniref:Uncharacterized protein n=1 Tax=Rhizorhabdus wittichii TaxID=160791 RepID=A0A975HBX3_9SPHN|nr:hypothetical protein [Rhizorhabdus wittichii]QTH19633.1 hypothetical protein HRJ34_14745 [Rhizorhabdus wittichii]
MRPADRIFLDAAVAIDGLLKERVLSQHGHLTASEVFGIYERLAVTMAFNTIGIAMAVASTEEGARRAIDMFQTALPHRISEGLDRAIAVGLEARAANPNLTSH